MGVREVMDLLREDKNFWAKVMTQREPVSSVSTLGPTAILEPGYRCCCCSPALLAAAAAPPQTGGALRSRPPSARPDLLARVYPILPRGFISEA